MNTVATILPLILLIGIMYFLLIRPQKKREKEINAMRSGLQVGDEIITIGGICGKIVKTKDDSLVIQVGADKLKFEIMRWAVSKVVEQSKKPAVKADEEEPQTAKKPKRMKKAAPVEEVKEEAVTDTPVEPVAETEEVKAEEKAEETAGEEK